LARKPETGLAGGNAIVSAQRIDQAPAQECPAPNLSGLRISLDFGLLSANQVVEWHHSIGSTVKTEVK
jgi:hypothetical protein